MQFEDSEIAKSIMLELNRKGVICLGIHDSFIVKSTYKDELYNKMMHVYQKRYKFEPLIH